MSIYRSKFKRPINHGDVTKTVKGGAAPAPAQDCAHLRKTQPVNYMLPASLAWVASLPIEVRPWALIGKYPRIANFLALEWSKPDSCAAYFDSLLVDRRPEKRQGFPADVHRELLTLRDHYQRPHLRLAE